MAFLAFNFVWIFFHYFQFPKKPLTFQQYLNDFSLLSHTNKVLGYTSLQLLAFVYFATAVASVYQLIYSTKYQKFPKYLDWWLKTRKQFGLLAFFLAGLHAIATIYIVNPFYLADWFRTPDQFSNLKILTLNGEIALILGILALAFMIILALTSINSIGNSLTFGEWRFVQSNLGIFSLILGTLHTIVMYSRIYGEKDKFNYNLTYLVTRVKMIAFIFPVFVLFSRLLLGYFPPLAQRIEKIRYGMINSKAKASSKHD
jgi:metalloreductase STEAP1